jgi:hypothetical protein
VLLSFTLTTAVEAEPFILETAFTDISVEVNGSAAFTKMDNGRWSCHVDVTIINKSEGNVTLEWIIAEVMNVTYFDGTSEEWGISSGNVSVNSMIASQGGYSMGWNLSEFGFHDKPDTLYGNATLYFFEASQPLVLDFTIIPEFSSMIVLLPFVTAILIAMLLYRKRAKLSAH